MNIWKGVANIANLLKADLHIHTEYSMDCESPLEKIINRCLELDINCIAVADHGTAEGALKMQGMAPFPVIVAEEVLTDDGEIMGMFLQETIPSGMSLADTLNQIKAQGGLVCIPHPFDTFRGSALGSKINEILEQIDIIEVFNARSPLLRSSDKARQFAEKYGFVQSAGSDAHHIHEIGNAYVEMAEFNGKDSFLQALARGKIHGHKTNLLRHINSTWVKIKNLR